MIGCSCYRALVRFMGSEEYVGVTRILPHFTEPDLVFGNIAGNTAAVILSSFSSQKGFSISSVLPDPECQYID